MDDTAAQPLRIHDDGEAAALAQRVDDLRQETADIARQIDRAAKDSARADHERITLDKRGAGRESPTTPA